MLSYDPSYDIHIYIYVISLVAWTPTIHEKKIESSHTPKHDINITVCKSNRYKTKLLSTTTLHFIFSPNILTTRSLSTVPKISTFSIERKWHDPSKIRVPRKKWMANIGMKQEKNDEHGSNNSRKPKRYVGSESTFRLPPVVQSI